MTLFDRALRLLSRRDHSISELKQKLYRSDENFETEFQACIVRLQELAYLKNQDELAQRWIRQWRSEGRGRYWIQGKLRAKGLTPPPLTDDEDERQALECCLTKKYTEEDMRSMERNRLARQLQQRGFSIGLIAERLKS